MDNPNFPGIVPRVKRRREEARMWRSSDVEEDVQSRARQRRSRRGISSQHCVGQTILWLELVRN